MTKARAPLSFDAALARIAGQIAGAWAVMASHVDRADRTVRNWGDPDARESIPLDCAIQLDLLYQAHGGEGAPLHESYTHQLELAQISRFGSQIELAGVVAESIAESGEAHAALLKATLPGASPAAARLAVKEGREALAKLQAAVLKAERAAGSEQQPP
jgi:hypothetical protein